MFSNSFALNKYKTKFSRLRDGTSLKSRLIRAASWSTAGTGIAQICLLFASVLIARRLGSDDFGRLGLIQSTLNTMIAFVVPTFGWALMRVPATARDSATRQQLVKSATTLLIVGGLTSWILSAGLMMLAPWICEKLFKETDSWKALRIAALSVFATGVFTLETSLLMGEEAFHKVAILNSLRGILLAFFMVVGAFWSGLTGVVWGITFCSYLFMIAGGIQIRHLFRKRTPSIHSNLQQHSFHVLRNESLPSFLSTIVGSLTIWLGNILLVRTSDGLTEVALFNAANHWKTMLLFVPTQINQSTIPIMANLWSTYELRQFRQSIHTILLSNLAVAGIPAIVVALAANWILHFYQLGSLANPLVLQLLVLSGVMSALCGGLGSAMIAMGQLWHGLLVNFVWAIVFILIAVSFQKQGAIGLSAAYLVAYTILFSISFVWVKSAIQRAFCFQEGKEE